MKYQTKVSNIPTRTVSLVLVETGESVSVATKIPSSEWKYIVEDVSNKVPKVMNDYNSVLRYWKEKFHHSV
jgi:hypothetical protein